MLSRARRRALGALVAASLVGGAAALAGRDDADPAAVIAVGGVPTITSTTTTTAATTTTTSAPPAPKPTAGPRPAATAPRSATTRRPLPAPAPSNTGVVAAFYYGWYGATLGPSRFHPVATNVDSKDPTVVARHIDQMRYGGIQAGIASWWGPGHATDEAFAVDLAAAEGTPFKWSLYYELEGPDHPNQSVEQLRASLRHIADRYAGHPNFLRVDGRPVIFVWPDAGDRCDMVARWNEANTVGLHIVQKRFPGHTGCISQAHSWHDYSPDRFSIEVKPWSLSVGPGFWHYNEGSPRLGRDPAAFERAVRTMAASPAMWKLVTTFNEWREGTAVEPAAEWASPSGYGVYLDILHNLLGAR